MQLLRAVAPRAPSAASTAVSIIHEPQALQRADATARPPNHARVTPDIASLMRAWNPLTLVVGLEGAGSWGVGLSRFLYDHEILVVGVDRATVKIVAGLGGLTRPMPFQQPGRPTAPWWARLGGRLRH